MKDNGEKHFELVHHNVSVNEMNNRKSEYIKFGKVNLNNQVSLSHNKTLQIAHQWAHCRVK